MIYHSFVLFCFSGLGGNFILALQQF